jgi:3-phytase
MGIRKPLVAVASLGVAAALPGVITASIPDGGEVVEVLATAETPALIDGEDGGFANGDDPAIWLDPDDPAASLVIATAKNGGLYVYDLAGNEVQHLQAADAPGPDDETGRLNNVDLVYGFDLGGEAVDLAVASDRGMDLLRIYRIDGGTDAPLTEVTAADVPFVYSADQAAVNEQATAYGVATWSTGDGTYVFASQRHETWIAMVRLVAEGESVGYEPVADLQLPVTFTLDDGTEWSPCDDPGDLAQVEGMVVDADHSILYAAQEGAGIWRIDVTAEGMSGETLIERVREYGIPWTWDEEEEECVLDEAADPGEGGEHIARDVEGLTIYHGATADEGYLIASSQGDSTYAVYERAGENAFIGSFSVEAGDEIDSAEHSDGAMVLNVALGDAYPSGLFVTHDGENEPADLDASGNTVGLDEEGEALENTNFKFVPWDSVANAFPEPLQIDTESWSPR